MFIHVLWNVFSEIKTSYLILSYLNILQKRGSEYQGLSGRTNQRLLPYHLCPPSSERYMVERKLEKMLFRH